MIVIATAGKTFIKENFKYISKFNSHEKICIVDNLNKGNDYIEGIKREHPNMDIKLINSKENLREWGSWWAAYNKYPNEEQYCFIHDSMYLKKPIKNITTNDKDSVYCFSVRRGWVNSAHKKSEFMKNFSKTYSIPIEGGNSFFLIFGCMFIASNQVMKKIRSKGIMKTYAKTRSEACTSERALGHVFKNLGIKINFFSDKSPSGKNSKGTAKLSNFVVTENELYIKIRSGRNYK